MDSLQIRQVVGQAGVQALDDAQLIALILSNGKSGSLPNRLAQKLAEQGLTSLQRLSFAEWQKTPGISQDRALSLMAALEAGRRCLSHSGPPVTTPEEAYIHVKDLAGVRKECFKALYLDGRRRLLRSEVVSVGTLTATLVHPREVFAPALELGAASLVVAHNHPSGDPTPSQEDRLLTERLAQAGRLLGLTLDDHLVVGRGCYVSLRQMGLLVA